MNEISFSKKTKEALTSVQIKKGCCRKTYQNAVAVFKSGDVEKINKAIAEAEAFWKCDGCAGCFVRAAFVCFGSVTDPLKRYHAELSLSFENTAELMRELMTNVGFPPKMSQRKGRYILYYKSGETIGDFLAYIGATGAAFDFINSKIVREVRNQTNRAVNCDTANIGKAIESAGDLVEIIGRLKSSGQFDRLPHDLQITAELRLKYDQLSMAELGARHEPPISKSGVKHRLDKISDFAKNEGL
jgi:hypothetical protein